MATLLGCAECGDFGMVQICPHCHAGVCFKCALKHQCQSNKKGKKK